MRICLLLLFSCCVLELSAQAIVTGKISDETGKVPELSTVALLHPEDSTVAWFTMSDATGVFQIKNVAKGSYLLHVSQYGYFPSERRIEVNSGLVNIGLILLKPNPAYLSEINIEAERAPMVMKKDTIEYNAGAFRTKPDAVVEDLLRKLPGVEVDPAGNIKAQGSTVGKIMVDGKEFFSNDPKVVSKNFPADAVKKVQVFDQKTDEEAFTGISDGNQDKTMNIVLKDDRKKLWFGNVMAGAGTNSRFQSSAKAFNFQPERQLAFLGMANNINQFGFTLQDYLDYNGGIQSFMNGTGKATLDANDMPVDFGQPVYGKITSGIGATNYTRTKKKGKSFNLTYMGSGQDKLLTEKTNTENYLSNGTIYSFKNAEEQSGNSSQRLNFSLKDKSDSLQQFSISGGASLGSGQKTRTSASRDTMQSVLLNRFSNDLHNHYTQVNGNTALSFSRKIRKNSLVDVFKTNLSLDGSLQKELTGWQNAAQFYATNSQSNDRMEQRNAAATVSGEWSASIIKKLGHNWYLEPAFRTELDVNNVVRKQGLMENQFTQIDSVSGKFSNRYTGIAPGLNMKKTLNKWLFQLNLGLETGKRTTQLSGQSERNSRQFSYFTPAITVNYEFKQTHRLSFNAQSSVNRPSTDQLFSIPSTVNRMQAIYGNSNLRPEYTHRAGLKWSLFDNFSFISIFADIQAVYTQDKINLSRVINPDFTQSITYINVASDKTLRGFLDFSAPIRKLNLISHLKVNQNINQGISFVNQQNNSTLNHLQSYNLSFENRRKNKWDLSAGAKISYTTSHFSLQPQLNNKYTEIVYNALIDYTPSTKWNMDISADLTTYRSSNKTINTFVPLLKCSVTRYLFKNNRGALTLTVFDLLNRNTGVQQQLMMNYFQQTRSNILARYAMLSFSWKINKAGGSSKSTIKIN